MDRYRVIANFAKKHNWTTGAELGVWLGVTTFFLMKNTDLKMYCIDSWTEHNDDPEYDWQFNKKPKWKDDKLTLHDLKENEKWNHAKNEQHFRENAEQWKDRITIFKGKSMDFLDQIPDNSLDFVFHDSDHSYPFVLNEIKAFLPKIKTGGYSIGDDFNWGTVKQSVQEAFDGNFSVTGKAVWYSIKN